MQEEQQPELELAHQLQALQGAYRHSSPMFRHTLLSRRYHRNSHRRLSHLFRHPDHQDPRLAE